MPTESNAEMTEEQWLERVGEARSEILVPGYWANLATNCEAWARELSAGPFWSATETKLDQWRGEYRSSTAGDLLSNPGLPAFVAKPEASARDKTFRRYKEKLDAAFPSQGVPIPRIGDLVRTRIVCRYMDGVEFLANQLEAFSKEQSCCVRRKREGRLEGYFAQHVIIAQEVIYRLAGQREMVKIHCEIQIASQMATSMWGAAHSLYEHARGSDADPQAWQWNPKDPQFISSQLGHMIHLADGLLVQLRDSARTKKA
jgi:hypothetical protein